MASPTARSTLPSASCAKDFYQKAHAYPRRSSSTVARASCVVSSRVTCSVRRAACGGAPAARRPAIIVQSSVHAYARSTAFLELFSASHVRVRLGLLSSMNSYSAPRAPPPKVVKGARDPPDPPYPFPIPSRPPAGACGAGFFSFFTANTQEKSPNCCCCRSLGFCRGLGHSLCGQHSS